MWWVETKEGVAPGQWGEGQDPAAEGQGLGVKGTQAGGVILFRLRPRRNLPSTPSIREQNRKV